MSSTQDAPQAPVHTHTACAAPLRLRVYIVRHGETDENRQGIIQGQLDTAMNLQGIGQATRLAAATRAIPIARAFSSDLKRATKTAEIVLEHHANVELVKQPELRERYMGELQGKQSRRDIRRALPASVESSEAFTERTVSWWENTIVHGLVKAPSAGKLDGDTIGDARVGVDANGVMHVLVVSHGGYIATMVRALVHHGRIDVVDPGLLVDMEQRGLRAGEQAHARSHSQHHHYHTRAHPRGHGQQHTSSRPEASGHSGRGVWLSLGGCYNTSVTIVDVYADGRGALVRYSDISHLLAAVPVVTTNADEQDG